MYDAEKALTERGETWMINPNSLTTHALPSDLQQAADRVTPEQREALQELARSIVREAGIAQAPEAAAREDKRLELERIFEASKHMTTLSASALVLIFAAQRLGVADVDVLAGMVVFGFSLLEALLGMGATLSKAQMGVRIARIQLGVSTTLFLIGVVLVIIWLSIEAQLAGG